MKSPTRFQTVIVVCLVSLVEALAQSASPPNIVFILADDLGQGDLSCNNRDSKIPTPYLDQLAAEGINFSDAHSPSGVCSPTRYALLTGRYAWRSALKKGVLNGTSPPLIERGRLTLPGMLRSRGYSTAAIGKWHLGHEWPLKDASEKVTPGNIDWSQPAKYSALEAGFTYHFGLAKPGWAFMENGRVLAEPTEAFDLSHIPSEIIGGNNSRGFRQPGFKFEDMIPAWIDKANDFIERNAVADTPFFVYFAPICPHRPINPNSEFHDKSECGVFGDFVVELDDAVGKLLATLEETDQVDNTLVIFSADNGAENNTYGHIEKYDHWSSNGRRGAKRDLYEGGHRVPFIARWPGTIPAGSQSGETICLTDIFATVASIIDFKVPEIAAEDSYNILPALKGETLREPIREATVHHSSRGNFAIRQGNWVYIDHSTGAENKESDYVLKTLEIIEDSEPAELYNLADDPSQTTNIFRQYPEKASALKSVLDRYQSNPSSLPHSRDWY